MIKHASNLALIALLAVAACSHGSMVPPGPSNTAMTGDEPINAQSLVIHGAFTEYSLPAGVHPSDLTRGPYDTLWFTNAGVSGASPNIYEMVASTGKVHTFTAPSFGGNPTQSGGFDAVISLNRSVYYVVKQPVNEDTFYMARITPEGVFSFTPTDYFEFGILTNFAQIPGTSNFTYGYCIDPCSGPTSGWAAGTRLTDFFIPTAITGGPGGDLYVTANYFGPPPAPAPSDSRVYVISAAGQIVHTFNLPNGAGPSGIVTGSDHNLWITESGANKIARMTAAGAVTQYKIPTANAGADRITYGYDGAQWFTEKTANKIGCVTTGGVITEYAIPTANSKPTGITPCGDIFCGTHGGLWFTETAANQIGRLNAPI